MTVAVCEETRRRIRIAVAAYAYEVLQDPIMSDGEYDSLAAEIDPYEDTGNAVLDLFFLTDFSRETGSWVHKHPDIPGLARIYEGYYKDRPDPEIEDLI